MAEPITSLPWVAENDDGNWRISSRDEQCTVAFVGHQSSAAAKGDAALIALAANNHQALVDALAALNWCRLQEHRGTACCPAMQGAYVALKAVREASQ